MSDIKIRRAHALTPKHARKAAEKMSARLSEAFDMQFVWEGEVLRFQRSGVDGQLTLGHKEVRIDAELGFLLALMKPKIAAVKLYAETSTPNSAGLRLNRRINCGPSGMISMKSTM